MIITIMFNHDDIDDHDHDHERDPGHLIEKMRGQSKVLELNNFTRNDTLIFHIQTPPPQKKVSNLLG